MGHHIPNLSREREPGIVERPKAGDRQPLKLDGKEDQGEQSQPKGRDGKADIDKERQRFIKGRVGMRGRVRPDRNGHEHDQQQG